MTLGGIGTRHSKCGTLKSFTNHKVKVFLSRLRKRWLKCWWIHPGMREEELGKLEITILAGLAGQVGSSGTELGTGAGASDGIWGLES